MNIDLGISVGWNEFAPDGRLCSLCNEPIYSKMYQLNIIVDGMGENELIESQKIICQPCKERP